MYGIQLITTLPARTTVTTIAVVPLILCVCVCVCVLASLLDIFHWLVLSKWRELAVLLADSVASPLQTANKQRSMLYV